MSTRAPVPTFRVEVNGAELPQEAAVDLVDCSVHQDLTAPAMFAFRLVSWDQHRLQVTWADDELFATGSEVRLLMGYVDELETLMVGEITGLEPEFRADDVPMLTVRGYDRSHRLLRGRRTRSFLEMKDSDIAAQIAGEHGLSGEAEDTQVVLEYVLQNNQTDMDFLRQRAWRNGFEVVVEDRTLYFRRHRNAEAAAVTLAREVDLVSFRPRLSSVGQAGTVEIRGWSPKDKGAIVGSAAAGDELSTMGGTTVGPSAADSAFGEAVATAVDLSVFSQGEADAVARGRFRDMALSLIGGEGECLGRPDLRAGTLLHIDGVGERFGGDYYVLSATHTYTPARGYRTAFTVRRNAT